MNELIKFENFIKFKILNKSNYRATAPILNKKMNLKYNIDVNKLYIINANDFPHLNRDIYLITYKVSQDTPIEDLNVFNGLLFTEEKNVEYIIIPDTDYIEHMKFIINDIINILFKNIILTKCDIYKETGEIYTIEFVLRYKILQYIFNDDFGIIKKYMREIYDENEIDFNIFEDLYDESFISILENHLIYEYTIG